MKRNRGPIWALLIMIVLAVFAIAVAQDPNQSNQKKQDGAASCSMDSCCCKGDSCPLEKEGAATAKNEHDCCGGDDSCDMKKNHADSSACCCGSESCDMKAKESMKNHKSDGECCCDMKMKHKEQSKSGQKTT